MRFILFSFLSIALISCSQKIYVVRHAEKATQAMNMSSDVPLTARGEQRAIALKDELKNKKIKAIYSTKTIRTESTARPTATHFGLTINNYNPRPDSLFYQLIKSNKKNTLIVGHSNTVDDIVNTFCGLPEIPGDLPETEYDNLFIIKKTGNHYILTKKKYGAASK